MNRLMSTEDLIRISRTNSVAVFGAGDMARHVIKFLAERDIRINQIYVSSLRDNPSDLLGIRIREISDVSAEKSEKQVLLVCVSGIWQKEVEEKINEYKWEEMWWVTEPLLSEIKYINADYDVQTLNSSWWNSHLIQSETDRLLRFVPRPCLEYLIFNILDHCNLRCKGCDHFACVADEKFYSLETVSRDIRRMSEIFSGDYIMKIAIMGGEPLLHPELLDILKEVRKGFPYATIRLSSNGLLLLRQDDQFWEVCRENDVTIVITKYPINLKHEEMKEKARQEHVSFEYFEGSEDGVVKHSFKKIINLRGDSNPVDSFSRCHISNYGNFVLEGKFYGCPFSAQSFRIFNKRFDQHLRMTEADYIDIYEVDDKEKYFEFAARPRFYCRYCRGLSPMFPWSRSEGKITEWIEE